MSYKKGSPFGYRFLDKDVWFELSQPKYLWGKFCVLELISTKYLSFRMYQN